VPVSRSWLRAISDDLDGRCGGQIHDHFALLLSVVLSVSTP